MSRIFIVEDEALVAMELEEIVTACGHEVTGKAADGETALQGLEQEKPDLVLMDIVLRGDMDGVETARIARERLGVPVVFVSAHSGQLPRVKEVRPYGFVIKPFDEEQVHASIELALGQRAAELEGEKAGGVSESSFQALLNSSSNPVLLVDAACTSRRISETAAEIFGRRREDLLGGKCSDLFPEEEAQRLKNVMPDVQENQGWIGEMRCRCVSGRIFPAEVTLRRLPLEEFICLVAIRDLSKEKLLEEDLEKEKDRAENMGITLKTIMEAVDEDKREVLEGFSRRITTAVFPALARMAREEERDVREHYRNVIVSELSSMFSGTGVMQDSRLISMTPTELKVCQFIQSGLTTKEIAETLHCAFDTIQTHRKNIRRKLELKGKKSTIYSFLQSVERIDSPTEENP